MRRIVAAISVLVFSGGLLFSITTSHASTPQVSITTCTDATTNIQNVLHAGKLACSSSLLSAIWHLTQSDSASHSGAGFASILVCSSKTPEFTYQFIRPTCPKYQNANIYYRTIALPTTPKIIRTTPLGYDGALLSLETPAASDSPIAYYLVKNLTSGAVTRIRPSQPTSLLVYGLQPQTKYDFQIIAVNIDGASQIIATSDSVTTGAVPQKPVITPASCAAGGTCVLGDVGPGNGIVFYVSSAGFNCGPTNSSTGSPTGGLCHYLEAPDNTWFGGTQDPMMAWAISSKNSLDVSGLTNVGPIDVFDSNSVLLLQNPSSPSAALGAGYANTLAIVAQNGACVLSSCTYAAGAAHAYAGNSLTDWYLPDPTELNQLSAWARGESRDLILRAGPATTYVQGGLRSANYWSSTPANSAFAWYQYNDPGGGDNEGVINGARKSDTALTLRPIRAF